jgi:hypothetical protein
MKTVTTAATLAPRVTRNRSSPLAWLSRPRQGRQIGSVRLPIGLVVVAVILLGLGIKEKSLSDASSAEPEQISLAKLIERGPEGNANIILTDYKLCPNIVFAKKKVGGQMVGDWTKVWIPIVRPSLLGFGAPAQAAAGNEIHALIYSTHVANEGELVTKLAKQQLRGMVINRIQSLGSEEREHLQHEYPGINCDRCLIIDEGRTPTSSELITLFLGGGGLLLLAGIGLGGVRVFGG